MNIAKPELLIPAGDIEKLETAIRFGADAVYVGAGNYSLRTMQTSFSIENLKEGLDIVHGKGKRLYLAMNIFVFDDDFEGMLKYLDEAVLLGIDGVIVSDPGLIALIRKRHKNLKIHLSTQANTLNTEAVKFWRDNGVKRIVLGRELSLEQAKNIRKEVPDIELEMFIHGAMCMSYSGRCLISKHINDRSANRGECSMPCRWEYTMVESTRPQNDLTIQEDERGTYILNSKDLCMIEHIPELINSGIDSFKIEGRMKTVYYVAIATKMYRKAIDSCFNNPKGYTHDAQWKTELENISHRPYSTGFFFGKEEESLADSACLRGYDFVGMVIGSNPDNNEIEVEMRNGLKKEDVFDIIDPSIEEILTVKALNIRKLSGEEVESAHNGFHGFVSLNKQFDVSNGALLRRPN